MKWNESQQTVETKLYLELNWGAHLRPERDQLRRLIQQQSLTVMMWPTQLSNGSLLCVRLTLIIPFLVI